MHRFGPQHVDQLDQLPMRDVGMVTRERFGRSTNGGNRRAVVTECALEICPLLLGAVGIAASPQIGIDRRSERHGIDLHDERPYDPWRADRCRRAYAAYR